MKAIIVEDEPPARVELERLLAAYPEIEIAGTAASLLTARGLLLRVRPDVVFLDINLSGESGFDLLDDVDPETAVVFATAYDEFALRAFDASAIDYLLKPIEPARLSSCVERLRHRFPPNERATSVYSTSRWIFVEGGSPTFVQIADIACVRAYRGQTELIVASGQRHVVDRSLQEWQRRLPESDFALVHRSAIVNLAHVTRVEAGSNYSYDVYVRGLDQPITMSRRQAARLRTSLS